jgi:hypothetical protein
VFLVYALNVVLAFILVKAIARSGDPSRHRWLRGALFTILLLADAGVLLWIDCHPRAVAYVAALFAFTGVLLPSGPTEALGRALGRWRFAAYSASVATVAALTCVYLPITTFLTSPGELGIHLEFLLKNNVVLAMVAVYLAAILYAFLPSARTKTVLAAIALAAVPLSLVYAYVYPFGYPMMNGLMFEQIPVGSAQLLGRLAVDVATVAAVACGTVLAALRLGGRRVVLAIALAHLSLAAASGIAVAKERTRQTAAATAERPVERPLQFSKTEPNVLVVLLDRFMGGFVEPILAEDPGLLDDLEGFTWYPRTVAAGDNSIAGVHPLLGGYDYTPREMNRRNRPLRDLSTEAFSILPHNFSKKGYATNLVNPRGLGFTMAGDCTALSIEGLNCTHIAPDVSRRMAEAHGVSMISLAESSYADLLQLLGAMRAAPYGLRAVLQQKGPWRPFLDHSAGTTFREWAELSSWPELSRTDADRGNLNVVFSILPHEPYFMGEDCLPKPNRLFRPDEELRRRGFASLFEYQHYVTARCTVGLVARYFRWMRDEGVYDNTRIVVVSDHGIVGPVEDRSTRAVAGGTQANPFVRSRSVLLVKRPGERGRLRTSEEFLPNAEVPRIVCEEIGGCTNPYLGDRPIATLGRDVPFYVSFVPWQFNLQEPNAFRIVNELVLLGRDPYDRNGWRQVVGREAERR